MKLHECVMGTLVIDEKMRVGHVVGLTYNVGILLCSGMSDKELFERTIPLIQFPEKTVAIHHMNLKKFG